jgi:tripartite-type tricarboxylate transporter receptor subunit TctC
MKSAIRFCAMACVMALSIFGSTAAKAEYPDRTIHLIVSIAPGGSADTLARLMAKKLSEKWGQPIVVENRDGANGMIAEDVVKHAAPDGYTLVFINNTRTIPALQKDPNFDPVAGLAPVAFLEQHPDVLVVNAAEIKANTFQEFIAYAKANPGKLNFGSVGATTPPYLMLSHWTGVKFVKIVYKGTSATLVALLGGEIQVTMGSVSATVPQIKTGKIKALAVSSSFRVPNLPDVPTIAEAGNLPGFEEGTWDGILAPAGTPPDVIAKVHDALIEAINAPDIHDVVAKQGWFPKTMTSAEFGEFLRKDTAKMLALLKSEDAN